jgi:hypothetical protein
LPQTLDQWLVPIEGQGVARDVATLQVSLGPNGTYFAYDKDGAQFEKLPPELDAHIQSLRDINGGFLPGSLPKSVSFGPNGSFVYINQMGGGHWSSLLQYQSPSLWEFLRTHPATPMVCLHAISTHPLHAMLM